MIRACPASLAVVSRGQHLKQQPNGSQGIPIMGRRYVFVLERIRAGIEQRTRKSN